MQLQGIYNNST